MKDYYRLLEVDPGASPEVLQTAYRALVRKHHPDLFHVSDKSRMKDRMRELNEAYETLSDPRRRARYDAQRPSAPPKPAVPGRTWPETLREIGFWFMLSFTVLMVLRIGGKLLLLKPVLLAVLVTVGVIFLLRRKRRAR